MSRRPIQEKKLRKLRRVIRKGSAPPSYVDLIEWLKLHRYAQTTGAAIQLLLDGKVHIESHTVGRQEVPHPLKKDKKVWGIAPLVPAHMIQQGVRVDD